MKTNITNKIQITGKEFSKGNLSNRSIMILLNLTAGTAAGVSWAVFDQVSAFWRFLVNSRGIAFVVFLAAFAVYLWTFYKLIRNEDSSLRKIDKVPFELLAGCGLLAVFADFVFFGRYLMYSIYNQAGRRFILTIGGIVILLIVLQIVLSTGRRIKSGQFARYTLFGRYGRSFGGRWKKITDSFMARTTFMGRMNLLLAVIFVLQMLLLMLLNVSRFHVLVFMVYKIPETILAYWGFRQLDRIRRGTERLAAGNLSEPISTKYMYRSLRDQAVTLNSIGEGLSAAVDQAVKSERMRTELITNVSHDIKTPLTSIINYVDLMDKEEIREEKVREYLEVLKRQSGKLKKLVEDLVEASKAATGNIEMHPEKCDLKIILNQAAGEFSDRMKARDLALVYTADEAPLYVNADGRYLWRVFDNLLDNICKYAMPGSRVYLDIKSNKDERGYKDNKDSKDEKSYKDNKDSKDNKEMVTVEIKNMSEQRLNISADELMERFIRGDASRNTEGSGLGLSIADSLMQLMGGELKISVDGDLFKAAVSIPPAIEK